MHAEIVFEIYFGMLTSIAAQSSGFITPMAVVQKGFAKARVAAARKLGIRLWIMLRDQIDYAEFCRRGLARQS